MKRVHFSEDYINKFNFMLKFRSGHNFFVSHPTNPGVAPKATHEPELQFE